MRERGATAKLDAIDSSVIDACLARARAEAGRDADLPSLGAILAPTLSPARLQVPRPPLSGVFPKVSAPPTPKVAITPFYRDEVTARPYLRRSIVRKMRWPLLVLGFVTGMCGGMALMMSPVGRRSVMQHTVKAIHDYAIDAWAAIPSSPGGE